MYINSSLLRLLLQEDQNQHGLLIGTHKTYIPTAKISSHYCRRRRHRHHHHHHHHHHPSFLGRREGIT
jgi:hypothetical protein